MPVFIVGYKTIRVAIPINSELGPTKTYIAPDGAEISVANGMATRVIGLGLDMEGMYLTPDSMYLNNFVSRAKAGEEGERVIEFRTEGRLFRERFFCRFETKTRAGKTDLMSETCVRASQYPGTFTNKFWIDGDNKVTCSLQWFHPKAQMLQFFSTEQQALSLDLTKQDC